MKPAFKYSGGKTKELKHIKALLPEFDTLYEPFAGGAAVAFALEKPTVLGDIRENVINCYNVISNEEYFKKILNQIAEWEKLTIEEREKVYYELRDIHYDTKDEYIKAIRWIYIRQQTFSGMDRVNSKTGKINSPFGWYGRFHSYISQQHHDFLKNKCKIFLQSFDKTIQMADKNDFILVDPPYYERNSDYGNDHNDSENEKLHVDLCEELKKTPAKWLLIHSDCELYRELYKDFNIKEVNFTYSQNFKGRDNTNSKIVHLYISNYSLEQPKSILENLFGI